MNNAASFDRAKRWLVNTGTVVAGGLGLYGLGVWGSGHWTLIAYGHGTIPMSPGAALLLVLLSVAVGLRHFWAARPTVRAVDFAVAGIAALASIAVCIQNLAGLDLPWEHVLARTDATVRGIPVGHMAPFTAAVFLGAVFSLLVLFSPMAEKTWLRIAGTLVAWLGGCYSAIVALAYATGTPLSYGGTTVPMAFLTAIALAALNLALLAEGGVDAIWRSVHFVDFSAVTWRRLSPAAWRLSILTAVAMSGIVLTGFFYLRFQQTALREKIAQELTAVADLKAGQIASWRDERLDDARFLMRAPFVAKDVAAFFAQPDSAALRAEATRWLDLMKGGNRYETVSLFDGEANARLVLPERGGPPDARMRERVKAALQRNGTFLSDLYASEDGHGIHLDLFAPVFAPGEQPAGDGGASQVSSKTGLTDMGGTPMPRLPAGAGGTGVPPMGSSEGTSQPKNAATSSDRPMAVILLQMDPRNFLYPLIQNWPMPSETAETLLVRREGDEIVYLNELRHQADTALKLRRSVRERQLPAAMGMRGETGVREGIDYRGVQVLAVTRSIPDTFWFIVAKVDQAEIYAPLRRQAWTVGTVVSALLLAAAAGLGMFSRQQAARYLHRELVAERERKALADRLALVMRHANDIILLIDDQGRIVEANDRAVEAYGYTLDELRRKTMVSIRPRETQGDFPAQSDRLLAAGSVVFEAVHQRKDGTTFPVEVSSRLVRLESESYRLSIIRDIAQRQAHEREIERMNRLYAALSQVNQALVRVASRQELFDEVCRVMVEYGGFRLAWIGEHDAARHVVQPVARAGEGQGSLEGLQIFTDTRAEAQGPTGTAIREGRGDVCNDFASDMRMVPWRDRMQLHGFHSAAAFPLRCRGRVWGSLTVYTAEAGFFRDKEIALLEETADDISFALDRLEDLAERKQTEAALRESEEHFRTAVEAAPEAIFVQTRGCFAYVNSEAVRLFGADSTMQLLGQPVVERFHPGFRDRIRERIRLLNEERQPVPFMEQIYLRLDGSPVDVLVSAVPFSYQGENGALIFASDITERKQAEAALRESEERFHRLVEAAPEAILIHTEGLVAYANPAAVRLYGADSAGQLVGQPMLDRVHPYFRESVRERLRLLNEERQTVLPMEQVHLRLDGQPVYLYVAAVPFVHEGKNGALAFATDFTERHRAEEALRLSQVKFETIFRSALDLNFISDLDSGEIVEASDAFCDALGSRETVLGRTMDDLHLWTSAAEQANYRKSLLADSGKVRNFAARLRLGSGEQRDFLLSGQTLFFEGKEYALTIGRDITELRQSERERTLLANTLAASLNEIYIFDAETWHFIFVNDSALHNLGYDLPQMQWMTPLDLAPDADRAVFEQSVGPLVRHEKPGLTLETRHRRADGSFYPVEVHVQLFESESGRVFLAVVQDITERKQAEEALRESQALYRSFVEQLPTAAFRKDREGRYVMVNAQFCRLQGMKAEEFLGKLPGEVAPRATAKQGEQEPATKYTGQGEEVHEQIMRTGQLVETEEEYPGPSGGKQYLHVVQMPVLGPDGKVIGTQGIQFDITERKLAEQKLRESEYFLRKSQEVSRLGSFNFDIPADTWTSSPTLDEIFGIDAHYPRNANGWLELVAAEQRQEMDQYLKRHVVAEHKRFEKEYRIVRPNDRQERWLFGLGELEFDDQGHTLRMIGTIQDITENKAAATALRDAKEFAENLIRTANTMIVWLDADGCIMLFNEAAEQVTGYTRAELRGKNWFEVLVPRERYPEVWTEFARLLNGGLPVNFENPVLTKSGEERFIAWQNSGVYEAGQIVGTISFGMDVTDRRRAEEGIRQLNAELEHRVRDRTAALEATNNELEAFSYSVSHDLRAPLRAIDGFTRILVEDHAKALDPEGRRVLDVISKEGQRMGQLIDDLLAFSRLGRRALQPVEVDLTAMARQIFTELAEHAPKRRLKLRLTPLPPAHADPSLLRQVLINLLDNAIKYTRPRKVGEIQIGGAVQGSENVYYIKDNGAGFDMQYADKLFGVFQRLHSDEEFEGTGVGLALVQRIIRRHGGRVWAEAKVDEGATFFFTLPVHSE